MKITLNGIGRTLPGPLSLLDLLREEGRAPEGVKARLNGKTVNPERFAEVLLKEGDAVRLEPAGTPLP